MAVVWLNRRLAPRQGVDIGRPPAETHAAMA